MNYYLIALLGVFLGFSMAAPPGPINSMIIDRSTKSFYEGAKIGFGAMTADFIFMILIFFFQKSVNFSYFLPAIYIGGALLFLYIAVGMKKKNDDKNDGKSSLGGYFKGLGTGLLNPYQIVWWLSAGLAIFAAFGLYLFYFFFFGIAIWIFFITLIVYYSYIKYGEKLRRYLIDFSSSILIIFSVIFFYEALMILKLLPPSL